jgi:hypothetical protein
LAPGRVIPFLAEPFHHLAFDRGERMARSSGPITDLPATTPFRAVGSASGFHHGSSGLTEGERPFWEIEHSILCFR